MSDSYQKPNFPEIFEEALREDRKEGPRDYLYASELSAGLEDGCERKVFHKMADDPRKDNTVGELLRFRMGNRIHEDVGDLVREYCPEGWVVVGVEMYGDGLPKLGCRVDMVMRSPDDHKVVIEVKTSRGRAFSYRNGPEDIRDAHKLQLRAGIEVHDADYGILLYVDREGSNRPDSYIIESDREQVVEIKERLEEELIEPANRYHFAKKALEHGLIEESEVPEPPATLEPEIVRNENKGHDSIEINEPWPCGYCPFKNVSCPGAVPDSMKSKDWEADGGVILKDKEDGYEIYNDKLDDDKLPDLVDFVERYE